ncbi:hypothetical protein D3C81_1151050 [compost metagenome]
MTKEELAAATAAFTQQGGKVEKLEEGQRRLNRHGNDPLLRYCQCGCEGNWTEHSMRLGESGRYR